MRGGPGGSGAGELGGQAGQRATSRAPREHSNGRDTQRNATQHSTAAHARTELQAAQAVQVPEGGPQKLASHTHAVMAVEPGGLTLFKPHAVQVPPFAPQKFAWHAHAIDPAGLSELSPHAVQIGVAPLESFHRPAGQCPVAFGKIMGIMQRELVGSHT